MSNSIQNCPVSVIIPFYNSEDTLVRSVESVLNQTRPPIQVVCINDASQDHSLQELQNFLKGRADENVVTIVDLPRNAGVYVARNAGLDAANQPYIAFQDADDFWHPQKLEIQFEHIDKNPAVTLSCHQVEVWKNEIAAEFANEKYDPKKVSPINSQKALWINKMRTDSIIMKNDRKYRFDENMKRGGDTLMWLEVVLTNDNNVFHEQTLAWKAKDHFGAGGLSGDLWKAGQAHLYTIRTLAQKGLISRGYAKILSLWCYLKLFRRYIIVWLRPLSCVKSKISLK